jgi:LysR family transcriptional regulator, transcriptional activator of nhaA
MKVLQFAMHSLNYHHLLYFWTVAKEGGISRAAEKLLLAQPTLSSQIGKLEKSIGAKLFERVGRSLVLTDTGQLVYRYADEIFTIGAELTDTLNGIPGKDKVQLTVGVPDILPKLVVYELLKPVLEVEERVQLVCYEGKLLHLLAELALHRLDVVLADSPLTAVTHIKAFSHFLGESSVTFLAHANLARRYKRSFPESVQNAPMLLPTPNTTLRRSLDQWFDRHNIRPLVAHEFEDSAVMKVFGQHGEGLFPAPTAIHQEICRQYRVQVVGQLDDIKERFYAISAERRLQHPAVVRIAEAARTTLFER